MKKAVFFYLFVATTHLFGAQDDDYAAYIHECEQRVHKIMPLLGFVQSHGFKIEHYEPLYADFCNRLAKKTAIERDTMKTKIFLIADYPKNDIGMPRLLVDVPDGFYRRLLKYINESEKKAADLKRNQAGLQN